MVSSTALRWLLGASLGLGAIDLVVIDLALAPEVVADSAVVAARPSAEPIAVVAPALPAPEPPVPEPPPPPPPAAPVRSAVAPQAMRAHVYFATMSAVLDDKARAVLDDIAIAGAAVVLEGHADERGDDSYNRKLSRKRALAVEQYLVERGVDRAHVEVRYAGEAGADDPDLWRDRRVDILITKGSARP